MGKQTVTFGYSVQGRIIEFSREGGYYSVDLYILLTHLLSVLGQYTLSDPCDVISSHFLRISLFCYQY